MADDDGYDDERSIAEEFWDSLGTDGKALPVSELKRLAKERPISLDDIDYAVSRYPFLDICNADLSEAPPISIKPKRIIARSGWNIYDRGDRLIAGPGRLAFGGYRLRQYDDNGEPIDDDESGGSQWVMPDGTIVKQFFDTAVEMIVIAKERWSSAAILGGYRAMQRAAWMAATSSNFDINFQPNPEDLMIFETIKANGGIKGVVGDDGFKPKPGV